MVDKVLLRMFPLRLRRVGGHEGRINDTLFQPAAHRPTPNSPHQTLVFFGGDVQDYPELMQDHRDNRNYVRWNLENTARILGQSFPNQHILVVRPSRVEYKSFSCYDNFVPSNSAGCPEHTPTHSALHHLERLLQSVSNRLKSLPTSELLEAVSSIPVPEDIDIEELHNSAIRNMGEHSNAQANGSSDQPSTTNHKPESESESDPLWWRDRLSLDNSRLTLVGFSKGCVVLNQLVYEFHYTKTLTPGDQHTMRFIERVESMYWLDGGHNGGKNTWITSRSLLETLTRLNVNIYIHVSPYQVKDETRPWIGREERIFTQLLTKMGAKIARYFHESGSQSLNMHFEVLANFKQVQDTVPAAALPPPDSEDDDI